MTLPARPRFFTLLALACAAVCIAATAAVAAIPPSSFEGNDGNLVTGAGTDWQDWTGDPGLVLKTDDLGDSEFGTGSKEQDPGLWDLNNGSQPGKSDIRQAAYATEVIAGDLLFYGAFERLDGSGNANVSFELNREPGTFDNGTDQVPIRTEGDLLITFDGNNSGGVTVRMCIWHGDRRGESSAAAGASTFGWYKLPGFTGSTANKLKGSENCTLLSSAANPTAEGSMNNGTVANDSDPTPAVAKILTNMSNPIADNLFGETSVNITDALTNSGVVSPCLDFGSIWMHSRSSDTPLSNMQDFVGPMNIQAATPCSIDLEKSVAVQKPGGPAPGANDYADADDAASAVLASTGDTLHYKVVLTNSGANSITVDTDPPLDDQNCPLALAGKVEGPNDTGANFLDPGDEWTYTCTSVYDAADADIYTNVASVIGHQGAAPAQPCTAQSPLPCVNDSDPANVQRAGRIVVVKDRLPGTSPDSFSFSTSADLATAGLGAFSLSDDGVAGHDRTSIDLWPNSGNGANGASYTVSEDATGPGYRLTGLSCSDGDSSTAGRTADIKVDPGETVTCTYSNTFTAPAIAIDKSGPASATAGDLLPYTIVVTNPGEESLADSTVVVTDPQCTTAPALQAKNRGADVDPTPDSLDPGDAWVYTCSGQTQTGQTSFVNQACVNAADEFGRQVNACDDATTVLGERQVLGEEVVPGNARLAGRSGCVARAFNAVVRGRSINKVVFRIDGKKRATLSSPDSKGRFKYRVNPKSFKPGSHLLVARATFAADSGTSPKTMRLRFQRCVRRQEPAFTG